MNSPDTQQLFDVIKVLEEAKSVDPTHPSAMVNLGQLYAETKQYNKVSIYDNNSAIRFSCLNYSNYLFPNYVCLVSYYVIVSTKLHYLKFLKLNSAM